jgi:hypothetical protein
MTRAAHRAAGPGIGVAARQATTGDMIAARRAAR